jgi:transketolase
VLGIFRRTNAEIQRIRFAVKRHERVWQSKRAYPLGWAKYVGLEGDTLTVDRFGASAPGDDVFKEFGFTVENVVKKAKKLL